ncbi:MAG: hypothetical protein IGS54_02585 [Elainella sp. C42_A2020_010]|nr:hypothetical protein [Elainella sp. C42_A2020_010]RNJ69394.1 MAG: hypothetical protein EDM05_10625 [Leptolyngbya sp. IPPAS B-1204]
MQAYKLKGVVDESGHLIITEPVNLAAGEVEVIILQSVPVAEPLSETEAPTKITKRERPSKIKALQEWFENTEPASPDFDPDQARWEALKEKYDL